MLICINYIYFWFQASWNNTSFDNAQTAMLQTVKHGQVISVVLINRKCSKYIVSNCTTLQHEVCVILREILVRRISNQVLCKIYIYDNCDCRACNLKVETAHLTELQLVIDGRLVIYFKLMALIFILDTVICLTLSFFTI